MFEGFASSHVDVGDTTVFFRRKGAGSTDRHAPTYVIRLRERRRQAHVAAHGTPPPPRVRKGKAPADLGITVEELAHQYEQVKSIRALAASLGVSYGALQRRMQAEGITRPTALTDEVRQRKRRRAGRTATTMTSPGLGPARPQPVHRPGRSSTGTLTRQGPARPSGQPRTHPESEGTLP